MRLFFAALVLAASGYLGWVFFHEPGGPPESARTEPPAESAPAERRPAPLPLASPGAAVALAPPGVFYATERVVVQTANGVKALNPGEEVKLMYRYKNGAMLVTNGHAEFVVKPSSLTKDRAQLRPPPPRQP